jgi:hypothetical protein
MNCAIENPESAETLLTNQWIDTAMEQARRLEEEALHLHRFAVPLATSTASEPQW